MKIRPSLIHLPMIAIAILSCATQAYSCTCGELTVAQQRTHADAVFLGTVIGKIRSDAVEKDGVQISFKVRRVWKGTIPKEIVIYAGATSDMYDFENLCAPPFKIGQDYVVFALGSGKLTTDVCAGTLLAENARMTIAQLGKSRRPVSRTRTSRKTKVDYNYDCRHQLFR